MDAQQQRRDEWQLFIKRVEARMERGARDYEEQSFTRNPGELPDEVMQELEDVCGWSFILWCRLRSIEQALNKERELIANNRAIGGGK